MGLCGLSGAAALAGCTRLSLPGETPWVLPPLEEHGLQAVRCCPRCPEDWRTAGGTVPFALYSFPKESRTDQ